jgi:hypothetical protein
MPEIPRFKPAPTTEEPAPTMAGVAPAINLVRRGQQAFVEGMGDLEKSLTDYFEKERKAKLAVKSMEAENAIDEDMNSSWLGVQQRGDYDKIPSDLEKELEKLNKKYSDMAGGDKDLGFAINSYFQKKATHLRNQTRVHVAGLISNEGFAQLQKKTDQLKTEYIVSRDPQRREEIVKDVENRTNAAVSMNLMNRIKGDEFFKGWRKDIQEGRIIDLYHNDPAGAILAIEKGEFDLLDSKGLATYKVAAQTMAKTLAKQKEGEEKEVRITDTIVSLKRSHTLFGGQYDYQMMLNKLKDIDFQKERKLTAQETHQAETIIKSEMQTSYDSIQQDFLKKLQQGTLTDTEVMRSTLPATGLMQGDKEWWLKKLEERKSIPNDAFLHSNPKVYSDTMIGVIKNPEKWDKDKIFSLVGLADKEGKPAGLKADDAIRIWNIHTQITKPDPVLAKKFTALQQALERMESYRKAFFFITPEKEGVVTPKESVQNDQLHYSAQQDFLDRVDKGEEPFFVLSEIMQKYTQEKAKGFFDRVLNWVLPSTPPPPEQPSPKNQPPEEKEGRYEVNGVIWNWTKAKGWYR